MQMYSFAFVDKYAVGSSAYNLHDRLPVFGAFTVALEMDGWVAVEPKEVPSLWGSFRPPVSYMQSWLAGISWCSPYDVQRYSERVGNTLAMQRKLDAPSLAITVAATPNANHDWADILDEFDAIRQLATNSPNRLPRWIQHALDLEPYLSLECIGSNQRQYARPNLVLGPLAKKMFTGTEKRLEEKVKEIEIREQCLKNALTSIQYSAGYALLGDK